MSKGILLGFLLLAAIHAIKMQHLADQINIESLTDEQKEADTFLRSMIPSVGSDPIVKGEQDDKFFKFQYMGTTAPKTMTLGRCMRIKDGDDGKMKFKLIEVIRTRTAQLNNQQVTATKKTYEVATFTDALDNLGWN